VQTVILWENLREKRPLEDLDVHGEVIKMNDQEIGYEGMDC
jgi:hypothetical protein